MCLTLKLTAFPLCLLPSLGWLSASDCRSRLFGRLVHMVLSAATHRLSLSGLLEPPHTMLEGKAVYMPVKSQLCQFAFEWMAGPELTPAIRVTGGPQQMIRDLYTMDVYVPNASKRHLALTLGLIMEHDLRGIAGDVQFGDVALTVDHVLPQVRFCCPHSAL